MRPYVFVIDRLGPYGAQRVCVTLLEEFAKAGHRVVLITYADDHPEAPLLSHSIERIKVPRSDAKWAALGQVVFSLRQTLRTLKPAAVLAFMPLANICTLMATRGSGIPVYVSEHNIPSMAMRLTSFRSFCLWIGMWFWYPRASGVITVSQDVKTALIAYLRRPRMHVRVIYNPVDYKRLSTESPAYIQASADIARWHASIGKPDCLVIVGALKEAKGHSIAIDALKLLPARYQLVFVGEGPLRKELLNRADIAGLGGRVHFVGEYKNVTAWMTLAHTVLVPSRWEGFGLVVAEAAYVKARVITSDALGVREIALIVGATVCRLDSTSLAEAIAHTGAFTRKQVWVNEFNPELVASRYLESMKS